MSTRYKKYYDRNHVVAYGRETGTFNHLFVWVVNEPPETEDGVHRSTYNCLKELLDDWNKAASLPVGPLERTILFCQRFNRDTVEDAVFYLAGHGLKSHCIGTLTYWRENTFAGHQWDAQFPKYPNVFSHTPITIGDVSLTLAPPAGSRPTSLDDFTITTTSSAGFGLGEGLSLKLKPDRDGASWSVDGIGKSEELVVWLDEGGNFTAGAIGLPVKSPHDTDHSPPLQRTKLTFLASPAAHASVDCRVWASRLISSVTPNGADTAYYILLDPRDSKASLDWMSGELNSRLLFGKSAIQSKLFSPKGSPFLLSGGTGAAARFAFLHDQMRPDGTMVPSDKVIFHLEGQFKITGPTAEPAGDPGLPLNIHNRDLMAGASATEFFDPGQATHIEFVKRKPAFFLIGDTSGKLFDDSKKKEPAFTSYIGFSDGSKSIEADFYSQAAEAPLFQLPTGPDPVHLQRRRVPLGPKTKEPLPAFAYEGYEGTTADYQDMLAFETSHLSRYRRQIVRPKPPKITEDTKVTLGVTPQGILAEITDTGLYSRLYFGNPDSAHEAPDFCVTVAASANSELANDVQQALAASQLFMVINGPVDGALDIIQPSVQLTVGDFSFDILREKKFSNAKEMAASVFVIKYVKDKSLDQLVNDTRFWACKKDLAPATTSKSIKDLTGLGAQPGTSKPYLKPLEAVWFDPNWQGILVLKLPLAKQPALLQALGPGFDRPDKKPPVLFAPYFGINALPATKAALTSSQSPMRPGSAFGAIHYDQPTGNDGKPRWPPAPTRGDREPGTRDPDDAANPLPPDDTKRTYALAVRDLTIGFANSRISSFDAHVLVQFSHLFWDQLKQPAELVLVGQYERRGSEDIYSLVCDTPLVIPFHDSSFLKQLTITRAQLSVVSIENKELTAFIGIDGSLDLVPIDFPLFSLSRIRLSSFGFTYSFNSDFSFFNFGFKPDGISADINFELGPLLKFLPVKLKGMSIALGNLLNLKSLHFTPLNFPNLGQEFHFAFLMDLDFGSLGQLAGDLRGLRVPLLFGWRGGLTKGLALGIQFPTYDGHLDIGIQQFIRLKADELHIKPCPDHGEPAAIGISAKNAKAIMFGRTWPPNAKADLAIFIPTGSQRKPSWAFGLKDDHWYVGGGYRIKLPDVPLETNNIRNIVASFANDPRLNGDLCGLLDYARPANEDWSVVASYDGTALDAAIAIADPRVYGIEIAFEPFGQLDVLYRRVNGQLGIFSLEYCLPGPVRTMQFGVATVRLPVFRIEIHTDGGFLVDFGFPWNNDFSRSCQVEVVIFVGSGGFYYGITSAAATELLQFKAGYGFSPDPNALMAFNRTVRLGFAARVGIGRSFTIGILSAEASLTLFGGLEGAASYAHGAGLFDPTLYALRGYMGLMLDISATVNFAIIRASARILAYVDVGLEIQQLLARRDADNQLYLVQTPVLIFADISLTVTVNIEIEIGCVSITIHLSFSANWHFQEQLSDFRPVRPWTGAFAAFDAVAVNRPSFSWNDNYRYWPDQRKLDVYATVLPCMADPTDVGEAGPDEKPCAVGAMLLLVSQRDYSLRDFAKLLLGWLLLYDVSDPAQYESHELRLSKVDWFLDKMRDPKDNATFWTGFAAALPTVVKRQFFVQLNALNEQLKDEPFVTIPMWPDSAFAYVRLAEKKSGKVSAVISHGVTMSATDAAFIEYCRHLISATLPEIRQLIAERGSAPTDDPTDKFRKWSKIWDDDMFEALPPSALARR
jgi:hypothetical protein